MSNLFIDPAPGCFRQTNEKVKEIKKGVIQFKPYNSKS